MGGEEEMRRGKKEVIKIITEFKSKRLPWKF